MKKRKLMVWAIIPAVALFFVVVLLAGGRSQDEQLHIRDYTDVKVAGLDGNGRVTCVLRTEELYPEIAGDEKNAVLLDMYTRLLESVKYKVEGSNGRLKEGDSVHVKVSLDEELAKECGVELIAEDFDYTVNELEEGKIIDVYEKVNLVVSGVSPMATAGITNGWEDEFLSKLQFAVDKANNIAKGDVITVTCTTTAEEFAANGYIPSGYKKEYNVKVVDTYIQGKSQLDENVLNEIWTQIHDAVIADTQDLSFRMLYKASGDSKYLYQYNKEQVMSINKENVYYLERKDNIEGKMNYVVYIVKAVITNGTSNLPVYFGFEYTGAAIDSNGKFYLPHKKEEQAYICSDSYEKIYNKLIGEREGSYRVE